MGIDLNGGGLSVSYAYGARYAYEGQVISSDNILRLSPYEDQHQRVVGAEIATRPRSSIASYRDRFGNRVVRARITTAHGELLIAAAGTVVLWPTRPEAPEAPIPTGAQNAELDEYLQLSPLVDPEAVAGAAHALLSGDNGLMATVRRVVGWVYDEITYIRGFTDVRTPAARVLEDRRGVCQDKAHLAIAFLRRLGIPARYVSGMLTRQAGETHAWVEFHHPEVGWLPADPTQNRVLDFGYSYLKFGIGRDYSDVPPLNGEYVSEGGSRIDRVVAEARLDGTTLTIDHGFDIALHGLGGAA